MVKVYAVLYSPLEVELDKAWPQSNLLIMALVLTA